MLFQKVKEGHISMAEKDNELQNIAIDLERIYPGLIESINKFLSSYGDVETIFFLPDSMSYEEKEMYVLAQLLAKGHSLEKAEEEAKLLLSLEPKSQNRSEKGE